MTSQDLSIREQEDKLMHKYKISRKSARLSVDNENAREILSYMFKVSTQTKLVYGDTFYTDLPVTTSNLNKLIGDKCKVLGQLKHDYKLPNPGNLIKFTPSKMNREYTVTRIVNSDTTLHVILCGSEKE